MSWEKKNKKFKPRKDSSSWTSSCLRSGNCGDCCEVFNLFNFNSLMSISTSFISLPSADLSIKSGKSSFARLLLRGVRAYQVGVSAYLPARCPMTPTCSGYAVTALQKHGALSGFSLIVKRLKRCSGSLLVKKDPVP